MDIYGKVHDEQNPYQLILVINKKTLQGKQYFVNQYENVVYFYKNHQFNKIPHLIFFTVTISTYNNVIDYRQYK